MRCTRALPWASEDLPRVVAYGGLLAATQPGGPIGAVRPNLSNGCADFPPRTLWGKNWPAVVSGVSPQCQSHPHQVEEKHGIPAVQQRLWLVGSPVTYVQRKAEAKLRDLLQLSNTNDHLEKVHVYVQEVEWMEDDEPRSPYAGEDAPKDALDADPQSTLEKRSFFSFFSSTRTQMGTLVFVNYFDHESQVVTFCGAHTLLPGTPIGRVFQVVAVEVGKPLIGHLRCFIFGDVLQGASIQILDAGDTISNFKAHPSA